MMLDLDLPDLDLPKRSATLVGMPAVLARAPRRYLSVLPSRSDSPPPATWRVELPSDREMLWAQGLLYHLDDLERMRPTLLALPDWVPLDGAIDRLSLAIKQTRSDAARLLKCSCMDLED